MTRWQHAPTGNRRYWTRDRIIEGLRLFVERHAGRMPTSDSAYNELKRGREQFPPASRVLEQFGSMARGFLAAGVTPSRVSMHNIDWTVEEDGFLLDNAGRLSLKSIARRLNRSYGSVRARLNRTHGKRARDVQCYLSAAQVAARFHVSYHRVQAFCRDGRLPANKRLGNWRIDLRDCEKNAELLAPKRHSYKSHPTDVGDYYRRYGIRRRRTDDGRVERYEASGANTRRQEGRKGP